MNGKSSSFRPSISTDAGSEVGLHPIWDFKLTNPNEETAGKVCMAIDLLRCSDDTVTTIV